MSPILPFSSHEAAVSRLGLGTKIFWNSACALVFPRSLSARNWTASVPTIPSSKPWFESHSCQKCRNSATMSTITFA